MTNELETVRNDLKRTVEGHKKKHKEGIAMRMATTRELREVRRGEGEEWVSGDISCTYVYTKYAFASRTKIHPN